MKFLSALGFLSRIRVPQRALAMPLNSVVHYFPFAGALIGGLTAGTYWLMQFVLPSNLAIAISMAASILITGAFHEDGLADTADAFGGGWSKAQVLTIMKDSRIGSFGAVAVSLALLIKFIALSSLATDEIVFSIIFAHTLSRFMTLPVIKVANYVRFDGKSKPLADGITFAQLFFALTSTILVALLLPFPQVISCFFISALITTYVTFRSFKRIGGYTGDVLGANQQISEIAIFTTLSASIFN